MLISDEEFIEEIDEVFDVSDILKNNIIEIKNIKKIGIKFGIMIVEKVVNSLIRIGVK